MDHYIITNPDTGEFRRESDLGAWAAWRDGANVTVELTEISSTVSVSTIFTGLDGNYGLSDQPAPWQTATFIGDTVNQQNCGGGLEQARQQHYNEIVRILTAFIDEGVLDVLRTLYGRLGTPRCSPMLTEALIQLDARFTVAVASASRESTSFYTGGFSTTTTGARVVSSLGEPWMNPPERSTRQPESFPHNITDPSKPRIRSNDDLRTNS